jgi:hypothetical protein
LTLGHDYVDFMKASSWVVMNYKLCSWSHLKGPALHEIYWFIRLSWIYSENYNLMSQSWQWIKQNRLKTVSNTLFWWNVHIHSLFLAL